MGIQEEGPTMDLGDKARKFKVKKRSEEEMAFVKSIKNYIDCLLKDGTFTPVHS